MSELKPCPCGVTPASLSIMESNTCKWAFVSGDCCGDWLVEFRTGYHRTDTPECLEIAIEAWNEVKRGWNTRKEAAE